MIQYFIIYLIAINAFGFLFMLIDKIKARRKKWRIPESTLMGIAFIGGSIGSLIGMYTFRHKTRHPQFTLGIPLIIAFQIILAGIVAVIFL